MTSYHCHKVRMTWRWLNASAAVVRGKQQNPSCHYIPCLEMIVELFTMPTTLDIAFVNTGRRLCATEKIAHVINPEDIMQHAVGALDDIVWTTSGEDVCAMIAQKKHRARNHKERNVYTLRFKFG